MRIGNSSGLGNAGFARITSSAGSEPPYIYSAVQVEETGAVAAIPTWTILAGGVTMNANLYNLAENGDLGDGVCAVPDDAIVVFYPANAAATKYIFNTSNYRGTY